MTRYLLLDIAVLISEVLYSFAESLYYKVFGFPYIKSVSGEVALVTGAGHGIGRQLALQLAALGASVVCWDIHEENCTRTANDIKRAGGKAWAFKCDVSDREEVAKVAEETRRCPSGRITILVNNAGIMPAKPFLRFTPAEVERVFSVNVYSQFWTLFEFLPDFISQDHGHVLSMSSVAGEVGTPYLSAYCSSKFAIKGLMEALYLEMHQDHPQSRVRFTTVQPFTVDTGLAHKPTTRFPSMVPINSATECARIAIEAMRAERAEVFVPPRLRLLVRLGKVLPRRAQTATNDFLNCTVSHKEN